MNLFLASLLFFTLFILLMGIGAIVRGKTLKGSCGGLGQVMGEENKPCEFCGETTPCSSPEEYKQRMAP